MSVALSRLSTTGRPRVRFGTKCASITSTCSQSAPARRRRPRRRAGRSRRTGSTARSAGAGVDMASTVVPRRTLRGSARAAQRGREHGVGAVPVRPQLHVVAVGGARIQVARGREQRSGVQRRSPGDCAARRPPPRRSRPGAASRSRTAPLRPGRVSAIAAASSSRCSLVSAGTSAGWRRQRASGRRRSAPRPGARRVDQHPVEARLQTACRGRRRAARRPAARGCSARPGRRGARRARRRSPGRPRWAPSAASSAVLPPGPAHRSSQRPPRRVRRPAPASAPGPPAGCPRPAPGR